jgi:hypothetical protein
VLAPDCLNQVQHLLPKGAERFYIDLRAWLGNARPYRDPYRSVKASQEVNL